MTFFIFVMPPNVPGSSKDDGGIQRGGILDALRMHRECALKNIKIEIFSQKSYLKRQRKLYRTANRFFIRFSYNKHDSSQFFTAQIMFPKGARNGKLISNGSQYRVHSQKSREVLDGVHPDARRQLVHPRIQHNCEDRLVLSVVTMRLQLGSCYFTPVADFPFTPTSTRNFTEIEAAD